MKYLNPKNEQIAIIGIGCHLPGGILSSDDLWQALLNKTDAITEVPENRWNKNFYNPDMSIPGKTHIIQGGFLKKTLHYLIQCSLVYLLEKHLI